MPQWPAWWGYNSFAPYYAPYYTSWWDTPEGQLELARIELRKACALGYGPACYLLQFAGG